MSLRSTLMLPEFSGLTDQQALDHLLEVIELDHDTTAYKWSGTNERLGQMGLPFEILAGWDQVLLSLPSGSMMDRMLLSGGVDYTLPNIRFGLQQVLASNPAEPVPTVINALLEIGIPHGPRWKLNALQIPITPTLQDITDTRVTIASEALQQQVRERYNAVLTAMSAGTIVTWEQARTALGAE